MRKIRTAVICAFLIALVACGEQGEPTTAFDTYGVEITVSSRGVEIPASLNAPVSDELVPLVIMAHGHGGNRSEGGGYDRLAEELASAGIASIRVDFSGCGDSTESFAKNNLTNMLLDLRAAHSYAVENLDVDTDRVGLMGYSMGGRLVAIMAAEESEFTSGTSEFDVMATWAPAANPNPMYHMFGGVDEYTELRAKAAAENEATYTTVWGSELTLGHDWFVDMEASKPLEAFAAFQGSLLVIYGDADEAVYPATVEQAIDAATSARDVVAHKIPGAKHGLGFYTQRPEIADEVIETTVAFFKTTL